MVIETLVIAGLLLVEEVQPVRPDARIGPRIEFRCEEANLGIIDDEHEAEATFVFKNTGDEPLDIRELRSARGSGGLWLPSEHVAGSLGPRLSLLAPEVDLGIIDDEHEVEATIRFRNTGDAPLEIKSWTCNAHGL